MVAHLRPRFPRLLAFDLGYAAGSTWACVLQDDGSQACGAHRFGRMQELGDAPAAGGLGFVLPAPAGDPGGYDGVLEVGAIERVAAGRPGRARGRRGRRRRGSDALIRATLPAMEPTALIPVVDGIYRWSVWNEPRRLWFNGHLLRMGDCRHPGRSGPGRRRRSPRRSTRPGPAAPAGCA